MLTKSLVQSDRVLVFSRFKFLVPESLEKDSIA